MALILTVDSPLTAAPADAPVIDYSGRIITSDRYMRTGPLTGTQTDAGLGGIPMTNGGSGHSFLMTKNGNVSVENSSNTAWAVSFSGAPLDVELSVRIVALPVTDNAYLSARWDGTQRYNLRISSAGELRLMRGATSIGGAWTITAGQRVGLRTQGATVSMLIDGVEQEQVVDAAPYTTGIIGVRGQYGTRLGFSWTDLILRSV